MMERLCAKFPCVIMTPLGVLVEPDVYCKKLIWSRSSVSYRVSADCLEIFSVMIHVKRSGQVAVDRFLCRWNELATLSRIFATVFTWLYSWFVKAKLACQLATISENITTVSRRSGLGGKTGTAMMPAFRQAINDSIKSSDGGYTKTALQASRDNMEV